MRKQLTGEPVAGKPHTGFGGRGRRSPFPTHIPSAEADGHAPSRPRAIPLSLLCDAFSTHRGSSRLPGENVLTGDGAFSKRYMLFFNKGLRGFCVAYMLLELHVMPCTQNFMEGQMLRIYIHLALIKNRSLSGAPLAETTNSIASHRLTCPRQSRAETITPIKRITALRQCRTDRPSTRVEYLGIEMKNEDGTPLLV